MSIALGKIVVNVFCAARLRRPLSNDVPELLSFIFSFPNLFNDNAIWKIINKSNIGRRLVIGVPGILKCIGLGHVFGVFGTNSHDTSCYTRRVPHQGGDREPCFETVHLNSFFEK